MTDIETICHKMQEAATTTLGAQSGATPVSDDPVLCAILESRIVRLVLEREQFSPEALPLPAISRQFEVQLEVLWVHMQQPDADRQALVGAVDRVVAELYGLTVNDLIGLESSYL